VAARFGDTPGFFQLYTPTDRDVATSLIGRAERAGCRALIVTLDTWITGWSPRDLNTANFPQLRGYVLANYFSDPHFRKCLAKSPEDDPRAAVQKWPKVFGHSVGWDDLAWMRDATSLPIVLKGINHPEDAVGQRPGTRQHIGAALTLDQPGIWEYAASQPVAR
jgi:lactate 2-monooxygenase